jgi:hypothetical protein
VTTYAVVVGNVGTVYHGDSEHESRDVFAAYVRVSKREGQRASGESVVRMVDGEIADEYEGTAQS